MLCLCSIRRGWKLSITVFSTISFVPSVEPPSELMRTAFLLGKYFANPACTALTTCPIVSALLKLGMPTRISASPISLSFSLTFSLNITPSMVHLLKGEKTTCIA
jgi:hypothetical protein